MNAQSQYTLDQVRANLKLIAGITALDLPHPDLHRGRMKRALVDVEVALGDIQTICADILQRGIVGEVVVPDRKLRVTIDRLGKSWCWLVLDGRSRVAGGFARTKADAKNDSAIALRVAGGAS